MKNKKNEFNQWTESDFIDEIIKLRRRKKYGIVWDEEGIEEERFGKESEGKLPILKEVKSKEIKMSGNTPTNILIEGENFHALSVLNYTHKGKIDVIYIDPPYNTGNQFQFNDDIVDASDPYRHSKWLSFMEKRIER